MAEILLSLTIIGVVAAITLPSLTGNINERTWNTQRKALYARFSQAIALMPSLSGYGTLEAGDPNNVAETFVTAGLAKVLKINNICDSEHLSDCGIADKVTTMQANGVLSPFPKTLVAYNSMFNYSDSVWNYAQNDTKAAAFETANGESIVVYYNPNCKANLNETNRYFIQPKMCANFVYDLNGSKGPNTVGKDIGFITALYSSDPVVVAPLPAIFDAGTSEQALAGRTCQEKDSETRIPNKDEIAAMVINRTLIDTEDAYGQYYWSSSISSEDPKFAWVQYFDTGWRGLNDRSEVHNVRCIKR